MELSMKMRAARNPIPPRQGGGNSRTARRLALLGLALLAWGQTASAAEPPCVWTGVERVVAVGDLHGDYESFVRILRAPKVGLIDEELRWTGGAAHLVQIGDVMDRGGRAKEIFDLLMRLEKEAAAAGGMVHVLLGNHEEANLTGIALGYPDYVGVDQFYAFLPDPFKKARERKFLSRQSASEQARVRAEGLDIRNDAAWREYWESVLAGSKKARGSDEAGQAYTSHFLDTYGRWLMAKNVVIRIDDVVYVHAGIDPKHSTWTLEEINKTFRFELRLLARHGGAEYLPRLVYDPRSPVRIRQDEENTTREQMARILAGLGAERMVVGHSFLTSEDNLSPLVPAGDIEPLFGGRVWMIDTGIWNTAYGGRLYALIVEDGEFDHFTEPGEPPPVLLGEPEAEVGEGLDEPEEVEDYLRTAETVFHLPGGAGRTDPWKVRLDLAGTARWAQFKHVDRPRPAALPDSYRYELAAYALDRYLGLGFVPPVVERTINDYNGSLQIFVDGAIRESERKRRDLDLERPEAFERAMADLKVFLNLVRDRCDAERDRDILIQNGTEKVFGVDFSQAFDPKADLVPGCDILRCSRDLYGKLRRWDPDAIDRIVGRLLNGDEVRALHARAGAIVGAIRDRIRLKGESAVLFD